MVRHSKPCIVCIARFLLRDSKDIHSQTLCLNNLGAGNIASDAINYYCTQKLHSREETQKTGRKANTHAGEGTVRRRAGHSR